MALHIRSWAKWQGAVVKKVLQSRRSRNITQSLHYAMSAVSMTCSWDVNVARFAALVNTRHPEAYVHRILAYAAHHDAMRGVIDVDRDMFGPLVLTNRFETVSRSRGAKFYDALIAAGICAEVDPGSVKPIKINPKQDAAEALPETEPEALPETPCLVLSGRGGALPPPPPTGGDSAVAGEKAPRPRDRERVERQLVYVKRLGNLPGIPANRSKAVAKDRLDALTDGRATDDQVREWAAAYKWVTSEKLARFNGGA